MRRLLLFPLVVVVLGCPKDKPGPDTVGRLELDTMPTDLSGLATAVPPAEPDTFKPLKLPVEPAAPVRSYPAAPDPLVQAVSREAQSTEFCYNEFGLKVDPKLRGNVAMLVVVGSGGVTSAKVGNSIWSPKSGGKAVEQCLNEKAKGAIKLAPGAVKPGTYTVALSFTPR